MASNPHRTATPSPLAGVGAWLLILLSLAACHSPRTLSASATSRTETAAASSSRDTVRLTAWRTDTLLLRDSTAQSTLQRGDTVFVTIYKERLRTLTRLHHDTLVQTRRDTLRLTTAQSQTATVQERQHPLGKALPWCLLAAVAGSAITALLAWRLK